MNPMSTTSLPMKFYLTVSKTHFARKPIVLLTNVTSLIEKSTMKKIDMNVAKRIDIFTVIS